MIQDANNRVKLTKEEESFLEDFLANTGFEIWNAGCSYRLRCDWSTNGFAVCPYDNPLRPEKEYKTAQGAINYMIKQDES